MVRGCGLDLKVAFTLDRWQVCCGVRECGVEGEWMALRIGIEAQVEMLQRCKTPTTNQLRGDGWWCNVDGRVTERGCPSWFDLRCYKDRKLQQPTD